MSDSSEEEDLSRFQEAVDSSFIKFINADPDNNLPSLSENTNQKPRSQRYLEEASHYNDVKVSEELQKRIGAKVSDIIKRNVKFVNMEDNVTKKQNIEGGVKLFKDSEGFLTCEDVKDTFTEYHNSMSRKIKNRRRQIDRDIEPIDENAKINSVAVSGDYVLSKKETLCWKSRRKEKIFKYRKNGRNNVLTALE